MVFLGFNTRGKFWFNTKAGALWSCPGKPRPRWETHRLCYFFPFGGGTGPYVGHFESIWQQYFLYVLIHLKCIVFKHIRHIDAMSPQHKATSKQKHKLGPLEPMKPMEPMEPLEPMGPMEPMESRWSPKHPLLIKFNRNCIFQSKIDFV